MSVLDPRKLSDDEIKRLSYLFDKLESKAREIGGASEKGQIEQLKPIIHEIDREIAKILNIPDLEVHYIQNTVEQLINRRISATGEVRRGAIRGEEEIIELEPEESNEDESQTALNDFFEENP